MLAYSSAANAGTEGSLLKPEKGHNRVLYASPSANNPDCLTSALKISCSFSRIFKYEEYVS